MTLKEKQPVYLHSMLATSLPYRPLISNKGIILLVPTVKTNTGARAFHFCAPLWGRVSLVARALDWHAEKVGLYPRLVPLRKALYHGFFICGQRCKWWSRRLKLTSSVISGVKPIIYIFFLLLFSFSLEQSLDIYPFSHLNCNLVETSQERIPLTWPFPP